MCLQKKVYFDVLCTCIATSLSKMVKLVWTMQELLLKTCTSSARSKKGSGMKLSMNHVWDRTAALTDVSRSTAQKIMEEKKKTQDEKQQPKQPPSSTSKV